MSAVIFFDSELIMEMSLKGGRNVDLWSEVSSTRVIDLAAHQSFRAAGASLR